MGIVAFCPQGHRVKVKDELAGRRGICPQCGARFRIPPASPPPPTARHEAAPRVGPGPIAVTPVVPPVARIVSLDADLAASLPRALPLAAGNRPKGPAGRPPSADR